MKRLTFFKVAKEEDIQAVLKEYEILRKNALKVSFLPLVFLYSKEYAREW